MQDRHLFESSNRYRLNLKIIISESKHEFSAKLQVGLGMSIPIKIDKNSFYYTHHHSPRKQSAPLTLLNNYLERCENIIKEELKKNVFLVEECCIHVIYETQPPIFINVKKISVEQTLALYDSLTRQILETVNYNAALCCVIN